MWLIHTHTYHPFVLAHEKWKETYDIWSRISVCYLVCGSLSVSFGSIQLGFGLLVKVEVIVLLGDFSTKKIVLPGEVKS